jgi:hypothetical protein
MCTHFPRAVPEAARSRAVRLSFHSVVPPINTASQECQGTSARLSPSWPTKATGQPCAWRNGSQSKNCSRVFVESPTTSGAVTKRHPSFGAYRLSMRRNAGTFSPENAPLSIAHVRPSTCVIALPADGTTRTPISGCFATVELAPDTRIIMRHAATRSVACELANIPSGACKRRCSLWHTRAGRLLFSIGTAGLAGPPGGVDFFRRHLQLFGLGLAAIRCPCVGMTAVLSIRPESLQFVAAEFGG